MTRMALNLSLTLLLLGGVGCSRKVADHGATASHDPAQEAGAGGSARIRIAEVRGIRLLQVPEARAGSRWVPGEALGDESANAVLSSPVKGIVSQLVVMPGQARPAGTTLALVQSPELARLKADWVTAKARLSRVQSELAREERLFQAGAGARRDLESIRSEAETAQAEEEATRLGLEAVGLKPGDAGATFSLRAPAAGSVVAWKVQRGQGVEAGQELGTFQAAQASIVSVELPQPGPTGWAPGAEAEVRHAGDRAWKARLEGTPTSLTSDTRRLGYRLRFLGGPLPIPGTPVEVRVPTERGVFLPQAALQQVDGRWGVFVVDGGEAAFHPVTRGVELKDEVLVLEGVSPGATVVAEGAYLLKALLQKRSQPEGGEGHGH